MNKLPEKIFSFDSPVMCFLSRTGNLIELNLLWLLCCLPVLTIGASTTAMHTVLIGWISGRDDRVAKPFFAALRQELLPSMPFGLLVTALAVLLCFDGAYLWISSSDELSLLWIPYIVLFILVGGLIIYGFPMLAHYRLRLGQVLSNSIALLGHNPKLSLAGFALHFWPIFLLLVNPELLIRLSFLWALVGGSFASYCIDKKILPIFSELQEDEK